MVMYIDDGNLWISSYSLLTNTCILQAAYYTIKNQLAKAGLSLDVKKCELIHFTKLKKDTDNLPSITIPNNSGDDTTTITPSTHVKWLGITFNVKLNFHEHVCKTNTKAEAALATLYMLGNTLKGLSAHYFYLLYTQTICPIMDYATPVWMAGTVSQIRPLVSTQNKALRLICAAFRTSHINALELEAAIPPLDIHLATVKQNTAIRLVLLRLAKLQAG
jgi:hypothetical protein